MICAAACVRMDQLRRNTLSQQECDRLVQESVYLSRLPLFIDDTDRNLSGLISTMRVMVRRHRARIVVIDYLQLVPSGEKFQIREQEIAHISRSLKRAAKALGVVMVVLCQLNRAADVLRENESPRLSHLRESGSIEQDADKVLFLWRPNKGMEGVDPDRRDDHGMLSIAKNRQGQLGQIKLAWNGPAFSYSDWSGSSVPDAEFDSATGEWP
jgi:replicative DNA helicase